ncbi:hypothetical protein [Micromonospora chokoriensis]|uniref:hypothetical protein n=1 Tax=Micromonospora chokoriensis TaxID=356851 RepID=UPI0012F986E4|nr:hypothetical protein [Micromonospora chokoriensis]
MSTSRIRTLVAVVVVFGGLAVVGGLNWEGWDGRRPSVTGPRLLTEGTTGGVKWSVVQVREDTWGECLYLRQDGATVERTCTESGVLQNYEISVRTLRGATAPILFGVLPAAAARAEVAADGGDVQARFRKADLVPLEVRGFDGSGRFVVQAAPPGPGWAGKNTVPVAVHDAAGRPLTPRDRRPR